METLKLHILLVNEDPQLLKKMYEVLHCQGHTAEMARNYDEAMALLEQNKFQVMVADMTMPDNDGVSLCKRWGHQLPIVMLQGSLDNLAQKKLSQFSCCFLDKEDISSRLTKATWTAFKRFKIDQQIERDLVAA